MDERGQFLKQITEAFGPPGLEDEVAGLLANRVEEFCDIGRDNLGSFIATKRGTTDGRLELRWRFWSLTRCSSLRGWYVRDGGGTLNMVTSSGWLRMMM